MADKLDFADELACYIVNRLPSDVSICESFKHMEDGMCWGVDWKRMSEGEASRWLATLIRQFHVGTETAQPTPAKEWQCHQCHLGQLDCRCVPDVT